ncbi:MAG: suppressor of fused domain protein, partial [Bacteroidales bacterium]|nr:suppressor of fused domain protein [Bacteroidales bacterium]
EIIALIALPILAFYSGHTRHWVKVFIVMLTIIGYKAYLIYAYHKLYKSLKDNAYYRFDKYGISMMVDTDECQVRFDTDSWDLVESVYEYDDYIVLNLSDKAEIAKEIHIIGGDKEKDLKNLLGFWQMSLNFTLNGKNPNDMPDYYSAEETAELQNFIEDQFGEIDVIAHEKESAHGLHVDLAVIQPTDERPYYTVCTIGVGTYRMTMNNEDRVENHTPEYYEFLIHLPADWVVLPEEGYDKEENWWPIRLLKAVAVEPKLSNECFKFNEIVSYKRSCETENPTSVYIDYPLPDPYYNTLFNTSTGRSVQFLQIIPLTEEEANHFDVDRIVDYNEKASYYYGMDTKSAVDLDEEERIALYTEHILDHFKKIIMHNA